MLGCRSLRMGCPYPAWTGRRVPGMEPDGEYPATEPDDEVPGENRMKRTRQEPDGARPATEPDDEGTRHFPDEVAYTGPMRSTHQMWGHICKYVPKSR